MGGPALPISNFVGAAPISSKHVGDRVCQSVCKAECDGSIPTAIICLFFFFVVRHGYWLNLDVREVGENIIEID